MSVFELPGGTPSIQWAQLQFFFLSPLCVAVGWIRELVLELAVLFVLPGFAR
jgi:hypothetical protein